MRKIAAQGRLQVFQRFVAALVVVGFGCGGQGGSNDTTTGTQADTEATSMPTSTAMSTSTATPTSGTTMEPTTGGPDKGMFCADQCMVDADCLLGGDDFFYSCKDNLCVPDGCVIDSDCVVSASFWNRECAVQADCLEFQEFCIDIGGGVGRCAIPSDGIGCDPFVEVMYPPIEGGASVVVCGNLDYRCKDGSCFDPCESDDECFSASQPVCNKDTAVCNCRNDADCQLSPELGLPVCINGQCGCATDADCMRQDNNVDRCYEGTCGCSSAAVCGEPFFDGSTVVCQ